MELWIGYGNGKHYSAIPIHEICQQLSPHKCGAIHFFHAFTGCDLPSSMMCIGKKTAWNAWVCDTDVIQTSVELTTNPELFKEDSVHMQRLEQFTIRCFSKTCSYTTVNDARRRLFTHKLMSLERIPPPHTQAALVQHMKRTLLV